MGSLCHHSLQCSWQESDGHKRGQLNLSDSTREGRGYFPESLLAKRLLANGFVNANHN